MGYYFGKGSGGGSASAKGGTLSLRDAISRVTGEIDDPMRRDRRRDDDLEPDTNPVVRRGGVSRKPAEPIPEALGDWQWPNEMKDLYHMLWGRADDIMGMEPGFGQDEIDAMFGRDFSKVRGTESGAREEVLKSLAAQGMLGTGTETEAMKDLALGTEKNVGDIQQNLFLANEAQKRQDIQSFTQLAQSLFDTLGGYSTTEEALNAARRAESNNMLSMLLQYYMASQGSGGG